MKKTPLNNLDEVAKELKNKLGGMDKILKDVGESLRIINSPVKEKNVTINGQNCTMSMLEDNRIIIRFSTKDEKDVYYEHPPIFTLKEMKEHYNSGVKQGTAEGRSQKEIEFGRLPFLKRLFY